jgi:hypothetical protein
MAHAGGRPLLYKTVAEMQKIIDEYFQWCEDRAAKKVGDDGKEYMISSPAPYTMSGLARRLGMDRRTLVDYAERDEFLPTIKAARERIHEDVETRLMEKQPTGAIFNLKNNFGWQDEHKVDHTTLGRALLLDAHNTPVNAGADAAATEAADSA